MWVLRVLLLLLAAAPAATAGDAGRADDASTLADVFEQVFGHAREHLDRAAPRAAPQDRPEGEATARAPAVAAPRPAIPWQPWLLPAGLLASAAVVGAMAAAMARRGRPARRPRQKEEGEAGHALAARQSDALRSMETLGLGRPQIVEDGPRGGTVVVRGAPPRAGCAFREGYLGSALGARVREVSHGRERCEFEIRR